MWHRQQLLVLLSLLNMSCKQGGYLQWCAVPCAGPHHGLLSAITAAVQRLAAACQGSLQPSCLAGMGTMASGLRLASTSRCSGKSCRSACRLQAAASRSSWNCLGKTQRQTASGWTGGPYRNAITPY